MMSKHTLALAIAVSLLSGCDSESSSNTTNTSTHRDKGTTIPLIEGSAIASAKTFDTIPEQFAVDGVDTYIQITPKNSNTRNLAYSNNAPAIHIIAADDGANGEKIRRAVMILQHLLTDLPDSSYGTDKASIANSMAQRNATLILTENDDANQKLMAELFVKEAYRQGQLQAWVTSAAPSTLEGLDFSSSTAFMKSLVEYGNRQSEEDFEKVIGGLIEGIIDSDDSPQWLLNSQSLMYRELTVEGDCHYMSNFSDYCEYLGEDADRDAAFEEILHLVQAQGIAPNDKYRDLQASISTRALNLYNAHKEGLNAVWQPRDSSWQDWAGDDFNADEIGHSYSHEYFAAVFEAFMGVSQHNGHGLDGYQALTRSAIETQDSDASRWVTGLFHGYLQYTANINSNGVHTFHTHEFPESDAAPTFKMNREDALAPEEYTYKSQWLLHAKIVGTSPMNLIANDKDNTLEGNQADNVINGKAGQDVYLVNANVEDCEVQNGQTSGYNVVCPTTGTDTLINIEEIRFNNASLTITP